MDHKSRVRFLLRACTSVAVCPQPRWGHEGDKHSMCLSHINVSLSLFLSLPLPLYLKINAKVFSGEDKKKRKSPARVAQWLRVDPMHQEIAGSIPGQGICPGWGPNPQWGRAGGSQSMFSFIDVSISPSPFLSL
uniref:Uncharacterized protein n=1 Tax=Molossus molossus TaxID=27622 RepID=A0A7J8HHQ5_MOLMO|nr:hypothetical protein HJG59_011030 [Molossus molossus]